MVDPTRDPTPQEPGAELTPVELAYQQALRYGEDLKRIYIAEKAKRQELELANQMLNAVFASTPDGLAVLDQDFVIQQANPVFARLVESSQEAVAGQPLAGVLPQPDLLDTLQRMAAGGEEQAQVELSVEQPVRRVLLASVARLAAGQRRGWVLTLQDQTERKRLEYQKIEFVNIAAHELRTPLSSLIGLSELVLDSADGLDDDLCECLAAINSSGHRLARTVDELLAFAQLSEGSLHAADVSSFDLADLLADIVEELKPRAEEKRVTLDLDEAAAGVRMELNHVLLRAVFYQLILNGINFNRPGGSVRVSVEPGVHEVRVQIADDGIGIPKSELEAIFQPFFQVEDHSVRSVGGLGLGLAIVQHATQALGGALTVRSALNAGTTFSLSLPTRQPEAGPARGDRPRRPGRRADSAGASGVAGQPGLPG